MAHNEVDTYYDYDERQWKSRRLGGGPVQRGPVCPTIRPRQTAAANAGAGAAPVRDKADRRSS
ncbi:hypothetical protein OG394_22290 [Kribbella sp. NBC_01245]|uniref:hypothetical protein n=1 Tax=Kribbella sp. NBC_01245 TaxID=2903578 RepID=UPI002E28F7B1|nr:hypothetical protein [Kribbella sp. NBC_01245]